MTGLETAASASRMVLPRRAAFWTVAGLYALLILAASSPSSYYVVFQRQWHFSAAELTGVFAVYASTVLAALLVLGPASDVLGRRPLLLVALLAAVASMAVFTLADGVASLMAARALQGAATGIGISTLGAQLQDLQPHPGGHLAPLINTVAPNLGMAAGVLGTEALLQYLPYHQSLGFILLLAAFVVALPAAMAVPETVHRQPDITWRPNRIAIPPGTRTMFVLLSTGSFATWAVGGLALSLGPSITSSIVHATSHLDQGMVIVILGVVGAVVQVLLRHWNPRRSVIVGSLLAVTGLAIVVKSLWPGAPTQFFVGSVVLAAGWGLASIGSFRALVGLADERRRAELISAIYVVIYVAFSVPSLAAGFAAGIWGLRATTVAFSIGVAVLNLIAVAAMATRRP